MITLIVINCVKVCVCIEQAEQINMQQQSTVRPSAVRIIIICIHGTWTMPYVLILIINQRLNDSSETSKDVIDE